MNSPMFAVCDNLAIFGKEALKGPGSRYWRGLQSKYYDIRDIEHWIKTGRHLPKPKVARALSGNPSNNPMSNRQRKQSKKVTLQQLLADV